MADGLLLEFSEEKYRNEEEDIGGDTPLHDSIPIGMSVDMADPWGLKRYRPSDRIKWFVMPAAVMVEKNTERRRLGVDISMFP